MEEENKLDMAPKEARFTQNQVREEEIISENNFIEILFYSTNQKEENIALEEFAAFIKSNKPNLSVITSAILKFLMLTKQYQLKEKILQLTEEQLLVVLEKVLYLLDQFKKFQFKSLPCKALIQCFSMLLQNCPAYSFQKLQEKAIKYWTSVEVFALKDYLELFQLTNLMQNNDVIDYLNNLIFQRKFTEATKIISYLNLQKKFNIKDLIKMMINQDKIQEAATLIDENDIETQKYFIEMMSTNKNASKGAKYIKLWKLNQNDFPELNERLEKNCIRYIVRSEDWKKAEERLENSFPGYQRLLGFVVEDLIYQKKLNEAYSIAKRHKLIELNTIQKQDALKILLNPKKTFKYIENPIFTQDNFGPTESNLDPSLKGNYWHLNDFGISEDQVHFISKEEELESAACKSLKTAKILGLDSEFTPAFTTFMQGGVSIFQISSPDCACIFDILALNGSKAFQEYFYFLMSSLDIIKIGHSLKTDFSQLRKNMNLTGNCKLQNYYELPVIFKALNPTSKLSSLIFITQTYLNKPISKFEQVSNWARRPLRKAQLHYAAMDATICVKLFQIFEEIYSSKNALDELKDMQQILSLNEESKQKNKKSEQEEPEQLLITDQNQQQKKRKKKASQKKEMYVQEEEEKITEKPEQTGVVQGEFRHSIDYKHFFAEPQKIKFLIDNMLQKLAKYLRNFGIDAEFIGEKNHHALVELAKQEQRVIVTRDTHFFQRKDGMPCYLLKSNEIQTQFEELHQFFKFEINQEKIHSRCVKCNNNEIQKISHEEAKKIIKWETEDEYIKVPEFWQCTKCLQVYWEGSTWKNSKERFETLANKLESQNQ